MLKSRCCARNIGFSVCVNGPVNIKLHRLKFLLGFILLLLEHIYILVDGFLCCV